MISLPQWLSSYANSRYARPFVYAASFAILIFAGDWTIHTLTNDHPDDVLRLEELGHDIVFAMAIGVALYYLISGIVKSAARYRVLATGAHDLMLILGSDLRIIDGNDAAVREYGWSLDELTGLSMAAITAKRDDPAGTMSGVIRTGAPMLAEGVHKRKDGSTFPVEVNASVGSLAGESVVIAVIRNITERRKREAFTTLLHEADRSILAGDPASLTLSEAVERLAALFPGSLAYFSFKSDDGSVSVQHRAGAHLELLDDFEIRCDDTPPGYGPTGSAIRSGKVQVRLLASDDDFGPSRDRALSLGFRAALSVPLLVEDQVPGAITILSDDVDAISGPTRAALEVLADQVALSLLSNRHIEQIDLQRLALDSVANAVLITDRNGMIEWVNPAFSLLTGYGLGEVRGQSMEMLRSESHEESFYGNMWDTVSAGRVWRGETFSRKKDSTLYLEEQTITPVKDSSGTITHFVAIKQDITSKRLHEERVRYASVHDALTELPNRILLVETIDRLVHRARRGASSALIVLDVDDFRLFNETLGQSGADQLLRQVADLIRASIRPGDVATRLGSDEFAIVVEGNDVPDAVGLAERIRASIATRPFRFGSRTSWLTASVGVATIDGSIDTDALLSRADSAVQVAKERGRNRVVAWDESLSNSAASLEAGHWVPRIKDALRNNGFVLVFQPVVSLASGRADHYEALLRMRGESNELISPDRFLRAAERYNLMREIDCWVVENVISLLSQRDGFRVFVNLGAESLEDESLLELIRDRMRSSGIHAPRLAFEVTETTAVSDLSAARGWIDRVKALGCMFALDDFGVGFSSLSYLRMLAVDWVKIDRSFISDIHTDSTSRALVQAVHSVATTLGKDVIAEGVEREAHVDVLREIGIGHGQGYHWGRPSLSLQFHADERPALTTNH